MRKIAPVVVAALLAACGTAPARNPWLATSATSPSPLHSENGQITGSKALTGRSASVASTPPGSAYAGMAIEPPAALRGD